MVGSEFIQHSSQDSPTGLTTSSACFHDCVMEKLQPSAPQPSYWKFLAGKLPLDLELTPSKGDSHIIIEEPEFEDFEDECDVESSFAQKIESIDAVLHIVADNHKSHELAQRRHSAPWSSSVLKSSSSAPVLVKPKNRWGPAPAPSNCVKTSPKVPSRCNPAMESSSSQSNATWSDSPASFSAQDFGSANNSRLRSLGLSGLRSKALHSKSSTDSGRDETSGTRRTKCRWSIPSNNSDSLLIYPQRCRDP